MNMWCGGWVRDHSSSQITLVVASLSSWCKHSPREYKETISEAWLCLRWSVNGAGSDQVDQMTNTGSWASGVWTYLGETGKQPLHAEHAQHKDKPWQRRTPTSFIISSIMTFSMKLEK